MTEFLVWRTAARACTKPEYKITFQRAIDEAERRLKLLSEYPDAENMRLLIGCWTFAHRLYKELPDEGTPAPMGGHTEATRLAA